MSAPGSTPNTGASSQEPSSLLGLTTFHPGPFVVPTINLSPQTTTYIFVSAFIRNIRTICLDDQRSSGATTHCHSFQSSA